MRKIFYSTFLGLGMLLTSCMSMQSKSVVLLNPDMTGKCTYNIEMGKDMAGILTDPKSTMFSDFGGNAQQPDKKQGDVALALASKLLSAGNVEAWKDVQFGYLAKDTVFFRGTAYFKNINQLNVSMFDSAITMYKNADGDMVLEVKRKKTEKDTAMQWVNHSYDSVTSTYFVNQYKNSGISDMMHYYMAAMVKGLDISTLYQLPGKIVSCSNFKRTGERSVSLSLTGNDVIRLLDSMSSGNGNMAGLYDKYMPGMGGLGGDQPSDDKDYEAYKILYGEAKPIQVVFKSNGKKAFDYDKEVAEAKTYYAAFRKTSGIEKYDSVQDVAKKTAEEESIREKGTLILTADDSANGNAYVKKMEATQYSGLLSFSGTLSKPLSNSLLGKVRIVSAVTNNGTDIADSLNKANNYSFSTDEGSPDTTGYINAYFSSSDYSYDANGSYSDSALNKDKFSFSLLSGIPEGTKYINLAGYVETNEGQKIYFKMKDLYIKKKDDIFKNMFK